MRQGTTQLVLPAFVLVVAAWVARAGATEAAYGPFMLDTRHADMQLDPGWNLVSVAVEPLDPHAATVAVSAAGGGGAREREALGTERDRNGGVSAAVWSWLAEQYVAVTEVHARQGYWVYLDLTAVSRTVMVPGAPPAEAAPEWVPGWNLIGPTAESAVPQDKGIAGPVWWWDVTVAQYRVVGVGEPLVPGRGYWIYIAAAGQ
jgi:hypothetical protein